jgi:hypothetical protein
MGVALSTCITRTARTLDSGREHRTADSVARPPVVFFPVSDWADCITVTIARHKLKKNAGRSAFWGPAAVGTEYHHRFRRHQDSRGAGGFCDSNDPANFLPQGLEIENCAILLRMRFWRGTRCGKVLLFLTNPHWHRYCHGSPGVLSRPDFSSGGI